MTIISPMMRLGIRHWARRFTTGLSWLRHRTRLRGSGPLGFHPSRGKDYRRLYNELLYAVATKHEGETRHETALRYIEERENRPLRGPFKA